MPKQSLGISSSVAVFLLLTSACCILSLSSIDDNGTINGANATQSKAFRVPKYVPNFAMSFVMSIGIAAMVILICKRKDLTTASHEGQQTRRHYLHRKHSLRSIIFFFVPTSFLHLNYLIVELCCVHNWTQCYQGTTNVSELIFHGGCIIFAICETIICWIMKPHNFVRSQWVWHGVAFIQAANFAMWFDSLLKEAYHRINENSEFFDSYFSFCNTTSQDRNNSDTWCSDSSIPAKWFIWSSPFLFPVTIEFALLVSETLLGKVIGGTGDGDNNREHIPAGPANANEETPLLQHGNENQNRATLPAGYANSCCSKIVIMISVLINIVYLLLTILVFVGYKLTGYRGIANQLQVFDNTFTIYSVVYDVLSIICCVVGIISCRKFRRPHSHTSFLEYLLLLATSGVFLQSMKRIVAFSSHSDVPMLPSYVTCASLDVFQSLTQIVFYYYAKDIKLQPYNTNGGQADKRSAVALFNATLTVISVSNVFIWVSDSFLIPEILPGITPSSYVMDQWPVFDNAVTPITIFFRFNSAILFWCIGTDVFQRGELHED